MVSGELRARAALPPENNPDTPSTGDWVSNRTGLKTLLEFEPWDVQPLAKSLYRPR